MPVNIRRMLPVFLFGCISLLSASEGAHTPEKRSAAADTVSFYTNYIVTAEASAQSPEEVRHHPSGGIQAQRNAEAAAKDNLMRVCGKLIVDGEHTVADLYAQNDAFGHAVSGAVSSARLMSVGHAANATVTVRMGLPLTGANGIMHEAILSLAVTRSIEYGKLFPALPPELAGTNFTGLIIDARDIDAACAFFPSLFDTRGVLVYGIPYVDQRAAAHNGLVRYVRGVGEVDRMLTRMKNLAALNAIAAKATRLIEITAEAEHMKFIEDVSHFMISKTVLEKTKEMNRIKFAEEFIKRAKLEHEKKLDTTWRLGRNPYRIVGWRTRGLNRCDIIIDDYDARIIVGNAKLQSALRECRAVIIVP
ncbi:MAG: hypothetical protein HZC28_02335 [Spirochaetes bacterium]|nr:hypothetical protein [Spirochaetota bacterium]